MCTMTHSYSSHVDSLESQVPPSGGRGEGHDEKRGTTSELQGTEGVKGWGGDSSQLEVLEGKVLKAHADVEKGRDSQKSALQ